MKLINLKTRHIVIGVDANYVHRSIVFYTSLSKVHDNFILYVFCFDDVTYLIFKKLNYKNIILYHTSEFEDKELLRVKSSKDRLYEYYWAINAFMAYKVIREQKTDFITLADCDLMFFQSPEAIFEELKDVDVLIQPNNYSYQFENDFVPYGYYCTSLQCFRNNKNGRNILGYWNKQSLEWCSHTPENGKFGEQKYLDEWRINYEKVREIANIGTNIAPWNVQKYDLSLKGKQVVINNKYPIIYYHYHSFRMNLQNYEYIITGDRNLKYPIPSEVIELIYKPYIKMITEIVKQLKDIPVYKEYTEINPEGNYHKKI